MMYALYFEKLPSAAFFTRFSTCGTARLLGLLAPSISKQYGILAVSNASVGKTGDSRWIFLSARPLELMLTPLWDLFKLLGYSKTSTGGFYATFKNVISRTKVIGDLPPEDPRFTGPTTVCTAGRSG